MKRRPVVSVFLVLVFSIATLSAALHLSVPVDHKVYQILDNAEIRGLIKQQMAVRPYSTEKILSLLAQIESHPEKLTDAEMQVLDDLKKQLLLTYGTEPSSMSNLFSTGFLRTYDEDTQMGASMGINLASQQTFSLKTREYDSRNSIVAFLRGDLGPNVSFNMDFGLVLDNLNPHVFLPREFTIPGEGFYMKLVGASQMRDIPEYDFYTSLTLSPELGISLLDNALHIRWGSIQRDWGHGIRNLMISKNARSFDGIDIQVDFTPWLRYAVINGSLGKFSLNELDGKPFFSDDFQWDKPYYRFDNNISAHRVELDLGSYFTFGIYEAAIWQKRFEISYLNPFTIYMFQQNNLGDIDNMLAGIDFSFTLPAFARFYGSLATTEMNVIGNPITMLKAPRNILGLQAGVVIPLPVGTFSSLTFQWTYLSPFFYSHYPIMEHSATLEANDGSSVVSAQGNTYTVNDSENIIAFKPRKGNRNEDIPIPTSGSSYSKDGRIEIKEINGEYHIFETVAETAYVNKGEHLGYPLDPNSQEFLLQLDLGLQKGWQAQLLTKYQVRSGQYGYSIEQYMDYSDHRNYPVKAFWANVFKHTLVVEASASKKLNSMPIELSASYRFVSVWEKPIITEGSFDGRNTEFGTIEGPSLDHIVQLGVKIFL